MSAIKPSQPFHSTVISTLNTFVLCLLVKISTLHWNLTYYMYTIYMYICMCCAVCLVAQSCSNLCDPMNCNLPGSSVHGGSSGKNTRVGCHTLLQGIFPTQGSNPHLPHCRYILYCLSYQGSPRILEWIAYPFSRGTSQPRSQTGVPCIAGGFLTSWATREFFVVVYILINGATGGQKFHVYFSFLIMPCIF